MNLIDKGAIITGECWGCMRPELTGAGRVHPVIVERSTRNRPLLPKPINEALDKSTQSWRRRALDAICERHSAKPVSLMQGTHVRQLRDELAHCPGAARNRLKALRALFRWARLAARAPSCTMRLPDRSELTFSRQGHAGQIGHISS
jgi:hypothetical protein